MKKQLFILLFCMSTCACFGQETTVFRYFNLDDMEVSNDDFLKLRVKYAKTKVYAYTKSEGDTVFVNLQNRNQQGTLSETETNQFYEYFSRLDSSVTDNNSLLIKYFQGDDPCSLGSSLKPEQRDENHQKLVKELYKKYPIQVLQVYNKTAKLNNMTKKPQDWLNDKNSILRKYFPYRYPCGSFLLIKPNGDYYLTFGEYGEIEIEEGIKKIDLEKLKNK